MSINEVNQEKIVKGRKYKVKFLEVSPISTTIDKITLIIDDSIGNIKRIVDYKKGAFGIGEIPDVKLPGNLGDFDYLMSKFIEVRPNHIEPEKRT